MDTTTLLVPEANVSPLESLVPRPLELIGTPSLYFFPGVAKHIMPNFIVIIEVFYMVWLVNKAFSALISSG